MKICPGCGKSCEDGSAFCGFCGFPLKDVKPADSAENPAYSSEEKAAAPAQTENTSESKAQPSVQGPTNGFNNQNQSSQFNNQQYNQQYTRPQYTQAPHYTDNTRFNNNSAQYNRNPIYASNGPSLPYEPLAIASLVLGILGVVFLCCYLVGLIPAILAIIFGIISRKRIKESPNTYKGSGFATAGLAMGITVAALAALAIILVAVGVAFSAPFITEFKNSFKDGFERGYRSYGFSAIINFIK